MKKKLLTILVSVLSPAFVAGAQEAFQHLSVGLEVGTTGVGLEVGVPVLTDKLVAKAGVYVPSVPITLEDEGPVSAINAWANRNSLSSLSTTGDYTPLYIESVAHLNSTKLVLEYYPFNKGSFHIVGGVFIGLGNKLASATISTSEAFWSELKALQAQAAANRSESFDLRYNVGDRNFGFTDGGNVGYVNAYATVNTVRPYLGIGFGHSFPESHFGFQCDLGVWYHGKPTIYVENEGVYDDVTYNILWFDDISLVDRMAFYPQLTFRLIYKIF